MTIAQKMGLGFGLFIFFALVVVLLTNRSLEGSRMINGKINQVYSPSVDALVRLRNLTVNAHMLIKSWALLESRTDAPEKTTLLNLMNEDLPQLLDGVDTLTSGWDEQEVALWNRISGEMGKLFDLHRTIQIMLPDLQSYSDPFIHMERNELAEDGGPLDQQKERVINDLDALLEMQEQKRTFLGESMIRSFDSLKFFVFYLGIALVVVGILIAILITRGIVTPVRRLRKVLLKLGMGIFPSGNVRTTNDEIGDMSKALNDLVAALKQTTEFSHAVAAGDFDAEYQPLSEDDVLGHALLSMRDELGQRERVLEMKVLERTEEVVRQKEEVERQSRKVVDLYNNVTDSIRYAKRLQESILPPEKRMEAILPHSFVYYRPKDIVSGDFYWMERIGEKVIIAAVDCTGHGVPGAFMSLIGHNGLNQVVKEKGQTRPAEILYELNRLAYEALHKDRGESMVRDGMDLALCTLDLATLELQFAGANNPLYVVRGERLLQFPSNKNAIGSVEMNSNAFTDHTIQLQPHDMVYLFSDGYADQFGGAKGKKYMYRSFRELLVRISTQATTRQRAMLHEEFNTWRGAHEQVDDILVMGFRV